MKRKAYGPYELTQGNLMGILGFVLSAVKYSLFGHVQPSASAGGVSASDMSNSSMWGGTTHILKMTSSGEAVSAESANTIAAYYACLRVVSEDIAKLPFNVKRKINGVVDPQATSPLSALLDQPNPYMSGMSFWESLIVCAAGWGGGFAEIQRTQGGVPIALHLIHPARVTLHKKDGRLVYHVAGDTGTIVLEDSDVFHVHGIGTTGYSGWSVLRASAESMGIAIAAQTLAGSFFRNGSALGGILKHPKSLTATAIENLRESWASMYGGAKSGKKPALLEEGLDYQPIGIPPNEAQFLETRGFQIEEQCRWFRLSPIKVGHNTSTPYSNIEALNIAHVNDALMPWIRRIEEECKRKLLSSREVLQGYYVKINVNALLRGDMAARASYYSTMITNGVMVPNQARNLEDMPPVGPEGDILYMQGGMTPLKSIAAGNNNPNAPKPPGETGRPPKPAAQDIMRPVVMESCVRIHRRASMAIEKAQKKEGFNAWLHDFSLKEEAHAEAVLSPVAMALCSCAGVTYDHEELESVCAHWSHCVSQNKPMSIDQLADMLTTSIIGTNDAT